MGCEAVLACKCIFAPTFLRVILTCKLGQTNVVFGVRSGFISRSLHAKLQVSVHSGYDLFTCIGPKLDFYILTPATSKSS